MAKNSLDYAELMGLIITLSYAELTKAPAEVVDWLKARKKFVESK